MSRKTETVLKTRAVTRELAQFEHRMAVNTQIGSVKISVCNACPLQVKQQQQQQPGKSTPLSSLLTTNHTVL